MRLVFDKANDALLEALFGEPAPPRPLTPDFGIRRFDKNDPTERDYLVTATIQVIVRAADPTEARVIVCDDLRQYQVLGPYSGDPMNGLLVEGVEDLTVDDPPEYALGEIRREEPRDSIGE